MEAGAAQMAISGGWRKAIALAGLAILATLAWTTIGPGKIRDVVVILLGAFAFRIVLTHDRSRYDGEDPPQ